MKTFVILIVTILFMKFDTFSQDPCYDAWVAANGICNAEAAAKKAAAENTYQAELNAAQAEFDEVNGACYQAFKDAQSGCPTRLCVTLAYALYTGCSVGASAVKEGKIYAAQILLNNSLNDAQAQLQNCQDAAKAVRDQCYKDARPIRFGNLADIDELPDILMLKVYPNPSNGIINVSFNVDQESVLQMKIYDLTGRIMHQKESQANTGINIVPLSLTSLDTGMYLLELKNESFSHSIKFAIER